MAGPDDVVDSFLSLDPDRQKSLLGKMTQEQKDILHEHIQARLNFEPSDSDAAGVHPMSDPVPPAPPAPPSYLGEQASAVGRGVSNIVTGVVEGAKPRTPDEGQNMPGPAKPLYLLAKHSLQDFYNGLVQEKQARDASAASGEGVAGQTIATAENAPIIGGMVKHAEQGAVTAEGTPKYTAKPKPGSATVPENVAKLRAGKPPIPIRYDVTATDPGLKANMGTPQELGAATEAATTFEAPKVAGALGKVVADRSELLRKGAQSLIGNKASAVEDRVVRANDKFAASKEKASAVNAERMDRHAEKTADVESQNRAAADAYQDSIRNVEKGNREATDEYTLKREEVRQANAEKQAQADADYQKQLEKVKAENAAREELGTRRGVLARQLDTEAADFGQNLKQKEQAAKAITDQKYDMVKKAVARDAGESAADLAKEASAIEKKFIKGSIENLRQFRDIARRGAQEAIIVDGVAVEPGTDLFRTLEEQGAIPGAQSLNFEDLKGYKTEMQQQLADASLNRDLPDDVYHATKALIEKVDARMKVIADRNGVGPQLQDAQATYRKYADTFHNTRAVKTGGSPVAHALRAVDPGYIRAPLTGMAGARAVSMLADYSPELAQQASRIQDMSNEFKSITPQKAGQVPKALPEQKPVKLTAEPEPPLPTERPSEPVMKEPPGAPRLMTAKPPDVNVQKLNEATVRKTSQTLGSFTKFDARILAGSAIAGFVKPILLLGVAGEVGMKGIASILDKPAVREWLARPSEAQLEALKKLPPESQASVAAQIQKFADDEAKRNNPVTVNGKVKKFLSNATNAAIRKGSKGVGYAGVAESDQGRKKLLEQGQDLVGSNP